MGTLEFSLHRVSFFQSIPFLTLGIIDLSRLDRYNIIEIPTYGNLVLAKHEKGFFFTIGRASLFFALKNRFKPW